MNIKFENNQHYHLYNRGNNKEDIFLEKENYLFFLRLLKKYTSSFIEVYSYCLLKNHFHLVIKIKSKEEISSYKLEKFIDFDNGKYINQAFSNMFNAYSKAFNKRYNRSGSLFQKNFKKILITDLEYLQSLILYVNTNPSHHSIGDYKNYYFSSYNAIINGGITSIKKEEVIKLFDNTDNFKYLCQNKKIDIENDFYEKLG